MSLTDISGASCSANICSSKIERGGRERNVLMTFVTEISLESADVSCDTCDSLTPGSQNLGHESLLALSGDLNAGGEKLV